MAEQANENSILKSVQVELTIRIGKTQPTMYELSRMAPDTVLPLDTSLDDPVDILVGTRKIAEGHLEEIETKNGNSIGVRITTLLDPSKLDS